MGEVRPIDLIREVKKRPALYRTDPPTDRTERLLLWKEIGAAVYGDWDSLNKATMYDRVLHLQKKWRSLRDAYCREVRARKSGVRPNKRVYMYFKKMCFLGGYEGEVSEDSDDSQSEDNAAIKFKSSPDESTSSKDPLTVVRSAKTQQPKVKRRKLPKVSTDSEPPLEDEMPMFQMEMAGEPEGDSDKLFLLSFLPEMRQLPPHIKMWVRAQIANVMQEAVNCQFNNTTPVGSCLDRSMMDIKIQRQDRF